MKRLIFAVTCLFAGAALASGIDPIEASKDERKPLRIFQTSPISFPQTLLQRGITSGYARIALAVDHQGALTDILVVGYSHEEFATAAENALRRWRYEPMRVRDESVATQSTLSINFEARGAVVSINVGSDLTTLMTGLPRDPEFGPCPLQKLDSIPAPLAFVEPIYTKDLREHGIQGQAVLEFYIDENGSVRVPAVVDADFWELGVLAMEAVRQWRFAPPTARGRPVLVRVRQAFYFGRESS
jgi:TonB family protein